jgi:hypothetical protein
MKKLIITTFLLFCSNAFALPNLIVEKDEYYNERLDDYVQQAFITSKENNIKINKVVIVNTPNLVHNSRRKSCCLF